MKIANSNYQTIKGTAYVCEIPKELGRVTALKQKNGRIIAETESRNKMIIPIFGKQK